MNFVKIETVHTSITTKYKSGENRRRKKNKKSVAEEYSAKENTISKWIPNRTKIIESCDSSQVNPSWKKLKMSDNKDLDEAVFTWFKNVPSNNIAIKGNAIKEKSLSLAKSIGLTNFRAFDGWIDKWKQRHNDTLQAASG